jgi:GH15 family glucan-1,4-alpha-glucosidase
MITLGNGSLLVGIDQRAQVRDVYFPFAGHANHVSGASGNFAHRLGIWIDGALSWLSDPEWDIKAEYQAVSHATVFTAHHDGLGVTLSIIDAVHNEKNLYLRSITIANNRDEHREVRVFFSQQFRISESRRGDTAYYDPRVCSIIHYKGHDAFLIHAESGGVSFGDYSVGLFDIEGKQGTYTDAEDGVLSRNTIEHGSVDSVIGLTLGIGAGKSALVNYWIAVGHSIAETHTLHGYVLSERPECLIASTGHYWDAWVHKEKRDLSSLDPDLTRLFHQSLEIIRVHADSHGGIIASSDTEMLNQGRDTYGYVWPRDAAISAHALDRTSYFDTASRFYDFMGRLIEPGGYLMHKYRVDGVLGSSWHPWVRNGHQELPIQEDETALVIFMLGRHFALARDVEFVERHFNSMIEPAADFMSSYIDQETGLPQGSYDLWEEKYGTSTFSAAAVYGALMTASDIATTLGKRNHAQKYRTRAERIREGILTYLYSVELGGFIKLIRRDGYQLIRDTTVDISSLHGLLLFGVLDHADPRIQSMRALVEQRLKVPTGLGGYMRYEGDRYYKTSDQAPPNPWVITTLWIAQHDIRSATTLEALTEAYGILRWVYDRATPSGVLPEQLHAETGAHLSAAPLVWSQAEFVLTALAYCEKYATLTNQRGEPISAPPAEAWNESYGDSQAASSPNHGR